MRAHIFHDTRHRYFQSFEPGEDWYWDFESKRYYQGPELAPPRNHPEDQPAPLPAGTVPDDWMKHLHQ